MRQESLFERPPVAPPVPGLTLVPDFVDAAEERGLLALVEDGPWESDWQRRIQQYGLGYGESRAPTWVRDLPPWLAALGARVFAAGYLERLPENAVINEYLPGRGIGRHRDYPAFGPSVAAISLGSDIVMDFIESATERKVSLLVPARSLWVASGVARWQWLHAIAHRKTDVIDGVKVRRQRRVSITFRTASERNRSQLPRQ